jgi:RNA polymerase-binding protein DksA
VARKGKDERDTKRSRKTRKPEAQKAAGENKTGGQAAGKPRSERAAKEGPVRGKTHLTAEELAHFRELLLAKRADLLGDVNSMEDEALQKSKLSAAGDLSTMPIHMADIGTANYDQEFALGLLDSERKLLREINDALQRIADGTYGICEGTGKPIAKARLEANPWARYCVEYARMVEQGLVKEGEPYTEGNEEQPEDILDEEEILDEDEAVEEEESETDVLPEETPLLEEDEELDDEESDWRQPKE